MYYLEHAVSTQRFADEDKENEPARRIWQWLKNEVKAGRAKAFTFAGLLQRSPRPRQRTGTGTGQKPHNTIQAAPGALEGSHRQAGFPPEFRPNRKASKNKALTCYGGTFGGI